MKERRISIDLLRIIAMLFIVIQHILVKGGVTDNSHGVAYIVFCFLEAIAFSGVDIFALISGYCSYSDQKKQISYKRYPLLWGQVFLYSFLISIIIKFLGLFDVSTKILIQSILPVTSTQYWYFTAYTGVFFLAPFINEILRIQTDKSVKSFTAFLLLIFSFYASVVSVIADPLRLRQGHSFLWLLIIFYIGGAIKKTNLLTYHNKKTWIKWICIGSFISGLSRILIHFGSLFFLHNVTGERWFYKDISPFILMIAIGFLGLFDSFSFRSNNIISLISSGTFGVYLIHVHPLIFNNFFPLFLLFFCKLILYLPS